jgi:CO/xanthine dehydrogenase FAD-binding subunit
MVERDSTIAHLVDLSRLPLNYIEQRRGSILIGATTTIRQLELSPIFRDQPLDIMYEAVRDFGTIQVRNMGTIGGNVCNGIPSADTPPPLIALDSIVKIAGPRKTRSIPLEELYRHVRTLSIGKGEILMAIKIPKQPSHTAGAYLRLVRSQVDIPLVSAAVKTTLDTKGRIRDCRVVLGAAAPTPLRARKAESFLQGKEFDDEVIAKAAAIASTEAKPISDVRASAEYRRAMTRTLVERAIGMAFSKLRKTNN